MIASPYDNVTVHLYGSDGFTAYIILKANQKWKVHKNGRYYQLSRKGVCCNLRLTERIFNELFRIVQEVPDNG